MDRETVSEFTVSPTVYTVSRTVLYCASPTSEQTAVLQVLLDDDVGDGVEHELDVLRVCGARHVGVDFFDIPAHVQVQELHFDVVPSVLVGVGPFMEIFKWN